MFEIDWKKRREKTIAHTALYNAKINAVSNNKSIEAYSIQYTSWYDTVIHHILNCAGLYLSICCTIEYDSINCTSTHKSISRKCKWNCEYWLVSRWLCTCIGTRIWKNIFYVFYLSLSRSNFWPSFWLFFFCHW